MKSTAAVVAPVLRSNAWLELILVGLAQINTPGPRSHSCGPLPGWPPPLWLLHSQRERERKQVREKETTSPSQSQQRLGRPNAAYYQSQVFPTPAGLVCAAGGMPACQKVFSTTNSTIYSHPLTEGGVEVWFLTAGQRGRFIQQVSVQRLWDFKAKRVRGMQNSFLLLTCCSQSGWECECGVWQLSKLD